MQVICVSRGTRERGRELAERLSEKMGYRCLGREDLVEAATKEGIQVGKLEMAMIKPRAFSERLAFERDQYLAFCRAYLCERALNEDIVYHGRTGHLLLPGVSHVLRARVIRDMERRIESAMAEMGLEREKAVRYIRQIDEDRGRWVRSMYGVAVEEAINYDITVNLQRMGVENAASALVGMAQLPDFQMTPASRQAMEDLFLGANARLALGRDARTYGAEFKVRADGGVVTVNYHPQDARKAKFIPEVLGPLPGIEDVRVTMATTNLLWIQEQFQPRSEDFDRVVEIATKWNAAIELLRFAPEAEEPHEEEGAPSGLDTGALEASEYDGGIEPDEPEVDLEDGGLRSTLDELAQVGRSGGGSTVHGNQQRLLEALDRTFPYTLVVIGDVFLSKGHAAQLRATRDLRSFLSDRTRTSVVTTEELGDQYLSGPRDISRAIFFLAVTVILYLLVFTNQEVVLAFLAQTGWYAEATEGSFLGRFGWVPKLLVSLTLFLFIPVVAFSYGRVTRAFLKLIKME
jgi:hypothetical protein